jgi:hypothetical protein
VKSLPAAFHAGKKFKVKGLISFPGGEMGE